jgi:hypothetical protein
VRQRWKSQVQPKYDQKGAVPHWCIIQAGHIPQVSARQTGKMNLSPLTRTLDQC